jgi:hypothetical protein
MDTFLELPFWLSVTLGIVYGAIWLVFFLVMYAAHRRLQKYRKRRASGFRKEENDEGVIYRHSASGGRGGTYEEVSVYDEDDD